MLNRSCSVHQHIQKGFSVKGICLLIVTSASSTYCGSVVASQQWKLVALPPHVRDEAALGLGLSSPWSLLALRVFFLGNFVMT